LSRRSSQSKRASLFAYKIARRIERDLSGDVNQISAVDYSHLRIAGGWFRHRVRIEYSKICSLPH
jgi:hypothetical protein